MINDFIDFINRTILIFPFFFLYLDPGTGGLLYSIVMGLLATSYYALSSMFYSLRMKLFTRTNIDASIGIGPYNVVLVSEGEQYASTFIPIMKALEKRNVDYVYMTMDESDRLLSQENGFVKSKFIGKSFTAWGLLNNLNAKLVITTTPGIDVLQIKKSKNVGYYIHVVHAPTDKSFNRTYSFDYFDSVIINGEHQLKVLRDLEQIRGLNKKDLPIIGCPYYDYLKHLIDSNSNNCGNPNKVLFAPTWGENGLLTKYGKKPLQLLLDAGIEIIIRPHPQSMTSEIELVEEIKEDLRGYENIVWDETSDPFSAMLNSSVLVSDISGIVFDYAFLMEKPVISIKSKLETRGTEGHDLDYPSWEETVLENIGIAISEKDIEQLPSIVRNVANNEEVVDDIRKLRKQYVVNFGSASEPIADYIEDKLHILSV